MAKGALSFLAGLASGYLNQKQKQDEKERQDKFDQIRLDEAARNKAEWDRKDTLNKSIAEAAQDGGPIVEDAQADDASPSPSSSPVIPAIPDTKTDTAVEANTLSVATAPQPFATQGTGLLPQTGTLAAQPASAPAQPDLAGPDASIKINPAPEDAAKPATLAASIGLDTKIYPATSANPDSPDAVSPSGAAITADPAYVAKPGNPDTAAVPGTATALAGNQGISVRSPGKPMFMGKQYESTADAQKAMDTYNSADARNERIAKALRANGDHEGAMRLEANARQAQLADFQQKVIKHNWGRQILSEGVEDSYKALLKGDPAGMAEAFNKSGQYKISGDIDITPSTIKLADGTTRPSNTASFNIVKQDGSIVPMKINADELGKTLLDAKDAAKFDIEKEQKAIERAFQIAENDKVRAQNSKQHKESLGVQYARLRQEQQYQDRVLDASAAAKKYADPLHVFTPQEPSSGKPPAQTVTATTAAPASVPTPAPPPAKPIPKSSEYKGISDGQKFLNDVKSVASTVGSGLKSINDNFDRIKTADQLRNIRSRMESNLVLSDEQKQIAIENGLMSKD